MSSTRRAQLLETLRNLTESRLARVRGAFEETGEQAAYRLRYEAETEVAPLASLDRAELLQRLGRARGLLVGVFHTCPELPGALADLLAELPREGDEIWLLPLVAPGEVAKLEDLSPGEIGGFLEELDRSAPGAFPRVVYRPLFELARSRGARLLAAPVLPPGSPPEARPRADGAALQPLLEASSEARVVALVGEHHLASSHLPAELGCLGTSRGEGLLRLVVSARRPYLEQLALGEPPTASALAPDLLALHAVSPWRVLDSFLAWLHQAPELAYPLRRVWSPRGEGLEPALGALWRAIASRVSPRASLASGPPWGQALGLEEPEELLALPLAPEGWEEVLGQLGAGRGYFLPGADPGHRVSLLLGSADLGAAAEEVSHAWNFACTGPGPSGLPPHLDLRTRILREAVGFLGSRLVVPDRPFWVPGGGDAPPGSRLGGIQELVRQRLRPRFELGPGEAAALYREDPEAYLGVAHLVGYLLGGSWPLEQSWLEEAFRTPPWADSEADLWERAWSRLGC